MKHLILGSLVVALVAAGCSRNDPSSSGAPAPAVSGLTEVPGMAKYALAEPIHVNNVSIIPVISRESEKQVGPDYATLAEAKKNAWIEIIEEPGDAEVSQLRVKNVGPKPILLLSGELLLGGKQDRVVAKDTIVPVGQEIQVPVYCVEPGRWQGQSEHFSFGDTTVPLKVREQALFGDQGKVWAEVGAFNESAGGEGSATTISKGLQTEQVQKQMSDGLKSVNDKLAQNKNVVGVMFLVDGKLQTLELFGNSRLFGYSKNSLLKGALAQAAVAKDSPAAKVDLKECAQFMADAMNSRRTVSARMKNGTADVVSAERSGGGLQGREVHQEDKSAPASSGLIHGSYKKGSE